MHNLKDIDQIGKKISIENASCKTKSKLSGLVIFETKNIVVLRSKENKIFKLKKNEILKTKEVL
jgi:RNase P/RNase MRP subunit p29